MNELNDNSQEVPARAGRLFSRGTLVAIITFTTVGTLLLTGHKAHLLGFAPFLLLLACPLMHLLMHGGHHNHGHSRAHLADSASKSGSDESQSSMGSK